MGHFVRTPMVIGQGSRSLPAPFGGVSPFMAGRVEVPSVAGGTAATGSDLGTGCTSFDLPPGPGALERAL